MQDLGLRVQAVNAWDLGLRVFLVSSSGYLLETRPAMLVYLQQRHIPFSGHLKK